VHDNGPDTYALKVEKASVRHKALKMEVGLFMVSEALLGFQVFVLNELKRMDCHTHFCNIFDTGKIGNYNYVVVSLTFITNLL
jgi:hypothetical protein